MGPVRDRTRRAAPFPILDKDRVCYRVHQPERRVIFGGITQPVHNHFIAKKLEHKFPDIRVLYNLTYILQHHLPPSSLQLFACLIPSQVSDLWPSITSSREAFPAVQSSQNSTVLPLPNLSPFLNYYHLTQCLCVLTSPLIASTTRRQAF